MNEKAPASDLDACTSEDGALGQREFARPIKTWIAEKLSLGLAPEEIRRALVESGVDEGLAGREVAVADRHPYVLAAKRIGVLLSKRESLLKTLDFYRNFDPRHLRVEATALPSYANFLSEYLSVNRPGLFKGAFDHWPARAWTPRSLLELVGSTTEIEAQIGRNTDPNYEQNGRFLRGKLQFAELISRMEHEHSNDVYVTANNFALDRSPFAFVRRHVGNIGDRYLDDGFLDRTTFLWMGPAGVVTAMHQDLNHILFCQVFGRKRFRLYPATQVPYMYNRKWVFSPLDPLRPIPAEYALFERATALEVVVEAGDLLYIPIGWWHHVVGETASISVSLTNLRGISNHFIDYPPDVPEAAN